MVFTDPILADSPTVGADTIRPKPPAREFP